MGTDAAAGLNRDTPASFVLLEGIPPKRGNMNDGMYLMDAKKLTEGRKVQTTILPLTIKQKWFFLILDGTKKEEYREIRPFYG